MRTKYSLLLMRYATERTQNNEDTSRHEHPYISIALAQFQTCRRSTHAARYHQLVLCDRNIFELRDVLERKAPQALVDVDVFLAELGYDLVPAPEYPQKLINDPKDQPILNAAIVADVDIIISGDKHFLRLDMERPCIMNAAQYLEWLET